MFDPQVYASLRQSAGVVAAAREHTGLATGPQVCDALRNVQASLDILDGVRADLLARLEASEGYTEEGASTAAGWARQQLRMGLGESRKNCRAGYTLRLLPAVAEALAQGRIRAEHVYKFTAGITKLGADVMADLEDILLPVAESCDPCELQAAISDLHEVLHPDELDKKYADGMERKDVKAAKCGEGYHLSGFLDIVSGAKVNAWLKDVSGPEYDGDDRTPGQRRVDALARLIDQALTLIGDQPTTTETTETAGPAGNADTGGADDATEPDATEPDATEPDATEPDATEPDAPDDTAGKGDATGEANGAAAGSTRAPRRDTRLLVLADLETLLRLPGAQPATLAGFGHIGTQLLGYLTCGSDITGVLADGVTGGPTPQANVLNVGRAHRLATRAQRDAVHARQGGVCAAPGCGLTYLEIHHVLWWGRDGGRTDLNNLVGICSRCHHLVHQGKLIITPDDTGGHTFARETGRIIDDHTRVTKQRIRAIIATIRHAAAGTADDGPPKRQRPPQERPSHPGTPPMRPPRFDPQWLTPLDRDRSTPGEEHLYEFIGHHA